jgi:hypothetical protein
MIQKIIQKIPLRRAALFAIALLFTTHFTSACTETTTTESTAMMPTITYPQTKRVDVVEKPFGQTIADPYRWLENDVRNNKEVAAWVESQNKVTNGYLNTRGSPFQSKRADGISTSIILDFRANRFSMSVTAWIVQGAC